MKFCLITFLIALMFSTFSFAQSVAPVAAPAAAVSAAPAIAAQPSSLQSLVAKIPGSMPAWIITILVFGVELILRFWPSAQPQSLLLYVGLLFSTLALGFTKLSGLIDQIAQNLKSPSTGSGS